MFNQHDLRVFLSVLFKCTFIFHKSFFISMWLRYADNLLKSIYACIVLPSQAFFKDIFYCFQCVFFFSLRLTIAEVV